MRARAAVAGEVVWLCVLLLLWVVAAAVLRWRRPVWGVPVAEVGVEVTTKEEGMEDSLFWIDFGRVGVVVVVCCGGKTTNEWEEEKRRLGRLVLKKALFNVSPQIRKFERRKES